MFCAPAPRLFVVDDDPDIAATLATILQMNGYSARFFTRPTEALAAAQQDPADLLISDVDMPVLTGIELAVLMSARYPKLKILLLSGQVANRDPLEHTRTKGHHFPLLMKPVPPSELLLRIGKLMVMNSPDIAGTEDRDRRNEYPPKALPMTPSSGAPLRDT